MIIKQISVFVENKPGRLAEIAAVLKKNNIDIRALSIADTRDFGILRLIVNNPDTAVLALKQTGFTVSITNVIAIGIDDHPGGLLSALETLYSNNISVEYMYAFTGRAEDMAFVILRVEDNVKAIDVLQKNNITILENSQIYKI